MDKPYSASCERNREPILGVLQRYLGGVRTLLEVGSGTGQHAVHFAAALPELRWQCADLAENLPGIRAWLEEAGLANTPPPLRLDVNDDDWPAGPFDAGYSANTLHILSWDEVQRMFAGLGAVLSTSALLVIYGPFSYGGRHTSASNADFDAALRASVAYRGIRGFEAVDALARNQGFRLLEDCPMPANNRCLVWRRAAPPEPQPT